MCFGGSAPRATIYMPDTAAYDRQFDLQKSAIESAMSSSVQMKQMKLQKVLGKQQAASEKALKAQEQLAENVSAQASRMAALIGTPPPEKNAKAPVTGANARGINTKKGKSALRIGQPVAQSMGAGAGLNII